MQVNSALCIIKKSEVFMGAVKHWWFEIQEEEKTDWIRAQLSDDEADEETEGWDELEKEYGLMLEGEYEEAEFHADYRWYKKHTSTEMHENFLEEIHSLNSLVEIQVKYPHQEPFNKMIYAHSVTLLETFLGDTVKSLVIKNDKYFLNAISNVDELKKSKFSLTDISAEKEGAIGLSVKVLSTVLYHNIPKVMRILESILGEKLTIDIEMVNQITVIRHDIVHRNGKTKDGELINLDIDMVIKVIDAIELFVQKLQQQITAIENA